MADEKGGQKGGGGGGGGGKTGSGGDPGWPSKNPGQESGDGRKNNPPKKRSR